MKTAMTAALASAIMAATALPHGNTIAPVLKAPGPNSIVEGRPPLNMMDLPLVDRARANLASFDPASLSDAESRNKLVARHEEYTHGRHLVDQAWYQFLDNCPTMEVFGDTMAWSEVKRRGGRWYQSERLNMAYCFKKRGCCLDAAKPVPYGAECVVRHEQENGHWNILTCSPRTTEPFNPNWYHAAHPGGSKDRPPTTDNPKDDPANPFHEHRVNVAGVGEMEDGPMAEDDDEAGHWAWVPTANSEDEDLTRDDEITKQQGGDGVGAAATVDTTKEKASKSDGNMVTPGMKAGIAGALLFATSMVFTML